MTQAPTLKLMIICTDDNAALLEQVLTAITEDKSFLSLIPQEIAPW